MATCESTTLARLNRNPFPKLVLPNWEPDDNANALYIKAGDAFELAPDALAIERAQQLVAAGFCPGATVVTNASQAIEFFRLQLGGRDDEVFAVMLLDGRRRFISSWVRRRSRFKRTAGEVGTSQSMRIVLI